jgi:hypothetical protein
VEVRGLLRVLATYAGCVLAAAVVAAPIAVERAVENVQFSDELGTLPVEVSLCHDGRSTLDLGLFGEVYWGVTGTLGFGAYARSTGPPVAGGSLASYVDPEFIQANVALINDPDMVVDAYAGNLATGVRDRFMRDEALASLLGGAVLFAVLPRRRLRGAPAGRVAVTTAGLVVASTVVSSGLAVVLFREWPCSQPPAQEYPMPSMAALSFSSPETREVARQVEPFIEKNTRRLQERARQYVADVQASFSFVLASHRGDLAPREGETLVLAEADTQGSFVGVQVRTKMYADLVEALGRDAVSMRTISGDVTSNGTVAESAYVEQEAKASGDTPTVAVGGDHDSETTWGQMTDDGIIVPDLDTVSVGGLQVSGANDREHKKLFGGIVTNDSGISEQALGHKLRDDLDDDDNPRIVLFHQPDAAAGYLGLDSLDPVRSLEGSATVPYDDGIPDQPPGIVSIGHLHELDGPWVLWNTDGDLVTWTVVDQLGTAGGVENHPTFNRFSTPRSTPLKPLSVRLQFVNLLSGLETGYATIECDTGGTCIISDRVDVGLPGGQPGGTTGTQPGVLPTQDPPASPAQ